jgi:hypothetical protein
MPRRSYNSNIKNIAGSPKFYTVSVLQYIPTALLAPSTSTAHIPSTTIDTVSSNNIGGNTMSAYEVTIINIIDAITDKINLDTILEQLVPLQKEITNLAEAEAIIFRIQNIILSVVDNISNKVNMEIILDRLAYLQYELNRATCLPEVYDDIADLLGSIIDSITNREDLNMALDNLQTINTIMIPDTDLANAILKLQTMILTIIDNITNKTSLNLVLERLKYVKEQITTVIEFQNTL